MKTDRCFFIRPSMVAFAALFVFGVSTSRASDSLTFFGFDENAYSPEAREGLNAIFSGKCFHGGVPPRAATSAAMIRNASKASESETPKFRRDNAPPIPSPPGRKVGMLPGLPLGGSVFNRNGVLLANGNCFGCHAGVVHGQVVAGLGNRHIAQIGEGEQLQFVLEHKEKFLESLRSDAERKEFTDFLDHARTSGSVFRFARTHGDNFGPYAVWRLGARFVDPENQGLVTGSSQTDLEKFFQTLDLPTVDPMPWWLMKYKTRDYWYADAAPDDAVHFSLNFTTAHPEANESRAEHIGTVAKALAFARETKSPPFPNSLNADLVRKGADLFHGRVKPQNSAGFTSCKTCHGTYTKKSADADWGVPGQYEVSYPHSSTLRDVKTDRAYNEVLQKLQPVADHIMKLKTYFASKNTPELAPNVTVPHKPGYIAPPLVGVWATAPYFHNGSVPTIHAVLNSSERPAQWKRNSLDFHAYDLDRAGLTYEIVEKVMEDDLTGTIYDTTLFGRSNAGHTFGDNLSEDERTAIIEFLKSLSGPDM